MSVFDDYMEMFPDGMYDSRQLTQEQFVRIDDFMRNAMLRGSQLTPRDFGLPKDGWHDDLDPREMVI
jgi:hypothetical protein